MKKTIQLSLIFAALLLTVLATTTQAQSTPSSNPRYKDVVVENPNAEADMKLVSDYVNSLVSGDTVKAKTLMASSYKGYGPSVADSANREQTISGWQQNYKKQSNRKVGFVTQTFRVKSGDLQGDWVSVWGDYSFTENGKDIKFPFQYTARVTKRKIDTDRIYYDRLYIFQALGFKVTPPESNK